MMELPSEVWNYLFAFLPLGGRCAIRLINKRLCAIIDNDLPWWKRTYELIMKQRVEHKAYLEVTGNVRYSPSEAAQKVVAMSSSLYLPPGGLVAFKYVMRQFGLSKTDILVFDAKGFISDLILFGRYEIVQYLLSERDMEIDAFTMNSGPGVVTSCVRWNQPEMLRLFLDYIDPHGRQIKQIRGCIIKMAVYYNHYQCLKEMLPYVLVADLRNEPNIYLVCLKDGDCVESLQLILEHIDSTGDSLTVADLDAANIVYHSVIRGCTKCLRCLLKFRDRNGDSLIRGDLISLSDDAEITLIIEDALSG